MLAVAVHPDGKRFVSAGNEPQIRWWTSTATSRRRGGAATPGPVHQLAFSGDGRRLISAGGDRTVRLWDGKTGEPIRAACRRRRVAIRRGDLGRRPAGRRRRLGRTGPALGRRLGPPAAPRSSSRPAATESPTTRYSPGRLAGHHARRSRRRLARALIEMRRVAGRRRRRFPPRPPERSATIPRSSPKPCAARPPSAVVVPVQASRK